ncbi:C39 family peptidase [Gemella haemolysans]|uniref:C39 family peptidase n=1 Tax=Gemella haemolysans TaxID=1379 RepID=UPI00195A1483|nr:C39 family peptidase [Gemella haemolysans]VTX66925.1 Peptidase_C39 like family protein [Gemella haemolysans]
MRRKYVEILSIILRIIFSIVLFFVESNKLSSNKILENSSNSKTNTESRVENVANARDGIQGVVQPSPFITTPNGVEANLLQNANGSLIGQLIYLQRQNLPEAEQKLLANNKDATQYVLGYLAGQQATPFEQGQTVDIDRKYPYYIQWDKRWAYDKLGGTNIAIGGCGPTCVAMALGGILDDKSITPKSIAEKEDANGYFTDEGTKWSFFDYIAKEYGVKSTGVPLSKEAINASLDKGNPIIASVHPGKFTTVGHIILITAKDEDGNYIINDPNSYTRTLKKWSYDELKTEIVAMWEFSK